MPNVFQIHANSIADVQNYLGDSCPEFLWPSQAAAPGQVAIRILPGSVRRSKKLQDGGWRLEADLAFLVRVADLPVQPGPDLKQTLSYAGQIFRIDAIETLAGGTLARFECNDPNTGA